MKTKKIYIDGEVDLGEWTDTNRFEIVNCLYDNIFDFTNSDDLKRVVLKVISTIPSANSKKVKENWITFDFMLVRDDIDVTIDALIRNFEEIEDYEKCSELIKLKNEI